jgi:hypothetical protein
VQVERRQQQKGKAERRELPTIELVLQKERQGR